MIVSPFAPNRYEREMFVNHKGCKVLGSYCWTHGVSTVAGVPGMGRLAATDDFVRRSPWGGCVLSVNGAISYRGFTESVIWANGDTEDPKRSYKCALCGHGLCADPVREDVSYREIITKKSYWSWAEKNAGEDGDGEVMTERPTANPDVLQG